MEQSINLIFSIRRIDASVKKDLSHESSSTLAKPLRPMYSNDVPPMCERCCTSANYRPAERVSKGELPGHRDNETQGECNHEAQASLKGREMLYLLLSQKASGMYDMCIN